MWHTHRIPLLDDNYAWALVDDQTRHCAVIDPSDADPILKLLHKQNWQLRWVLATHHHWDHTQGIAALTDAHRHVRVYGSQHDAHLDRIPKQTHSLVHQDNIDLNDLRLQVLSTPGHTQGSLCYYSAPLHALFTGDTLFTGGCGRLLEGTAAQLYASLTALRALPGSTGIYCGHEYTQENLHFATTVLPQSALLDERRVRVMAARKRGEPTVPAPLSLECATNPFLLAHDPKVLTHLGLSQALEAFTALREWRNTWVSAQ